MPYKDDKKKKENQKKYHQKNKERINRRSKEWREKNKEQYLEYLRRYRKEGYKKGRKNINLGKNNAMWKGDKVGYIALHDYIEYHKPKPDLCEKCKERQPYDLANISGKYKRDINDFEWLCRKCHMIDDGRMNNLKQYRKAKT